jgi:hypothetical protein
VFSAGRTIGCDVWQNIKTHLLYTSENNRRSLSLSEKELA